MTKCGRYGLDSFDYSPKTIRESVKRSLERLKTDYLDTVYLHDVEFVCTPIAPRLIGNHTGAIKEEAASYGLAEGDEALIRGEGDQKVLDALSELRDLQREGLIKNVGITGKLRIFQCTSSILIFVFIRLPATYPFAPRHIDSPHSSLQASRCVAVVFSSLFAKLDFSRVYPSLLQTCEGWTTACSFTHEHGPSHINASFLAPCPSAIAKGSTRCERHMGWGFTRSSNGLFHSSYDLSRRATSSGSWL